MRFDVILQHSSLDRNFQAINPLSQNTVKELVFFYITAYIAFAVPNLNRASVFRSFNDIKRC